MRESEARKHAYRRLILGIDVGDEAARPNAWDGLQWLVLLDQGRNRLTAVTFAAVRSEQDYPDLVALADVARPHGRLFHEDQVPVAVWPGLDESLVIMERRQTSMADIDVRVVFD